MFTTSEGKAYWLKVHELPEASKSSRGQPIKTLLAISPDEDITTSLALEEFSDDSAIFMATSRGVVKKVVTSAFSNARTHGIIAIKLDPGDKLISSQLTTGDDELILVTRHGFSLRFHEKDIRTMGRNSRGVQGIRLTEQDELSAALCVNREEQMLVVTEYGYGKRVDYDNFTPHGRATKGQRVYKANPRTGEVVQALSVSVSDDIVCITSQGNAIKLKTEEISVMGKAAQGVRIVNIEKPDYLVGVARVAKEE
jgi:DNA gyrase subunit A